MSQTYNYFKEITLYPRPSKKEEKIRTFLIHFFSQKWFEYQIDSVWNLIVYVPPKNSSSKEIIILQAHMDMVCVKTKQSQHDFFNDPIQFYEKSGYMYAKNTTLWADNGIWIALCMSAVWFSSHPALELVFTVDEEDGMTGVAWLDYSLLKWTKVINLDSEDEDEICIWSAWWVGIIWKKKIQRGEPIFPQYTLRLSGMKWGHSGVEIHKNRGNAIVSMIQFLWEYDWWIEIVDLRSWVASNVIPSSIEIILWIENKLDFEQKIQVYIWKMKQIFDCDEVYVEIETEKINKKVIQNGIHIFKDLWTIPNGVYSMSEKILNFVETSLNVWIMNTQEEYLQTVYLLRSSDNEKLNELLQTVKNTLQKQWFELTFDRGYPWWQDDPNSLLVQTAQKVFKKELGYTPKLTMVHAWLECGAMVAWLKRRVNAISIGPNISFVHSTEEKVEIETVWRLEKILMGILEKL